MRPIWVPAGIPTPRTRDGFSAGAGAGEPKTPHGYPVSITSYCGRAGRGTGRGSKED